MWLRLLWGLALPSLGCLWRWWLRVGPQWWCPRVCLGEWWRWLLLGLSLLRRHNAIKALILQIEWLILQIERVG